MSEDTEEQARQEASSSRRAKSSRRYSFEEKLRAVKLHEQEGFPMDLVQRETGVGISSLWVWVRHYRAEGEEGLRREASPRPGRRLPTAVSEKILEVKRAHAHFGVKRIAEALRRWFLVGVSAETVRRRLHEAGLQQPRARGPRNMTRPRFFERATPNQMWQSDIFTFRLGGRYAYIAAFMDDYSRYLTGLGLYRSPTAEAVIETYRRAVAEYQPPKEMLTDRGRQYTNWRGKSRFDCELQKDRVAHLVSRPQHPMTLGKVERFWSSLWQEFLVRAQFNSFEECEERLKLWVRYYNCRRPHQGIGGLCPADRFFEIAAEMKKTLQAGVAENVLELALRGQPRAPFYLVGRMEGQSVVLRAEKGKLKLSVDEKELSYDLEKGRDQSDGVAQAAHAHAELLGVSEGAGSAGSVDGAGQACGRGAGAEDQLDGAAALATAGDGGHAAGPGGPGEAGGGRSAQCPSAGAAGPAGEPEADAAPAPGPAEYPGNHDREVSHACVQAGPPEGESDPAGASRPDQRGAGGASAGHLPQELLPVGAARALGDAAAVAGPHAGSPGPATRPAEGTPAPGTLPAQAAPDAARTDCETARPTPAMGATGR